MKIFTALSLLAFAANAFCATYEQGIDELSGKVATSLSARSAQVATVLDLSGLDGATTQLGKLIAQDVFDKLVSNAASVTWIDPSQRDFIMKENQLAADNLMDPATQKRLGKLLGLSTIVIGTITELGETARVQLRAVEIETSRVIASASVTIDIPKEMQRLNDRSTSVGAQAVDQVTSIFKNETLVSRAKSFHLYPSSKVGGAEYSVVFEIENVSGQDLWLFLATASPGTCRFEYYNRAVSGIGYSWTYGFEARGSTHERRVQSFTSVPAGGSILVNLQDICERNKMPNYESGTFAFTADVWVDFGKDIRKMTISIPEFPVTKLTQP